MRSLCITLAGLYFFLISFNAKASSLWIETPAKGQIGKPQQITIRFGSYTKYHLHAVSEGEFQDVKDFNVWTVSPSGKHSALQFTAADSSYLSAFTPSEEGLYVILLENKQRKVEDWRKSTTKIGITKQHYYARATVQVGNNNQISTLATTDLIMVKSPENQTGKDVTVQLLFHGKPVAKETITFRLPGMKDMLLTTDLQGKVVFKAPKSGFYFALAVLRFETPGTYKGEHFDVFREKSVLTFAVN